MFKYRKFRKKYSIWFSIASFLFIWIPGYIDTIWDLVQKFNGIGNTEKVVNASLNLNWLYAVTAPIGLLALAFIIWQSSKPPKNNDVAWSVYDNLVVLFKDLMNTDDEKKRSEIHSQIEYERGRLPDKKLDELLNLFLEAEAEMDLTGVDPQNEASLYMLRLNNERMRNHIKSKYGDRVWKEKQSVNTANQKTS